MDENQKVITIVADLNLLEKIRGSTESLVVALPSAAQSHLAISGEQKSGAIKEFRFRKLSIL